MSKRLTPEEAANKQEQDNLHLELEQAYERITLLEGDLAEAADEILLLREELQKTAQGQ